MTVAPLAVEHLRLAINFGESPKENALQVVIRLLLAFVLTYALGFERELRGSPAGERTFALIGVATAVVGLLSVHGGPNALVGAVTGIGFIGGGLVFRTSTKEGDVLRGITTAAAIFAAATIGSACGEGFLVSAILGDVLLLLLLELGRLPGLRVLDARPWSNRFDDDEEYRGLARPTDTSPEETDSKRSDGQESSGQGTSSGQGARQGAGPLDPAPQRPEDGSQAGTDRPRGGD